MIGLFDSGLGGLTVVRRVRERLPNADLGFLQTKRTYRTATARTKTC